MALKIVPASEPVRVETVIVTIYSAPGLGKTSLGFSAEGPLLLDTDGGVHRSAFRKEHTPAAKWADIADITAQDVKGFRTLVLDTAGRALDHLATDIIQQNPKLGRGGALTLQGYGELKARFAAYLRLIRSFGLDIVLLAHSEEQKQGDEYVERIDIQGGSKQEIYKLSDAMARLGLLNGQRYLTFSPTETRFGKDPAGIGNIEVPDLWREPLFLGQVIQRIKDALNRQSESQKREAEQMATWTARVEQAATAAELTALIAETNGDKRRKRVLHDEATRRGYTFGNGAYTDPNEKPEKPKAEKPKQPPKEEPESATVAAGAATEDDFNEDELPF